MAIEKNIVAKGETGTAFARVYVAGCVITAKAICQSHVLSGGCVNVSETDYIYTGGRESGVICELINYPRFPKTTDTLFRDAVDLAEKLIIGLGQGSATVMGSERTVFLSRRSDD